MSDTIRLDRWYLSPEVHKETVIDPHMEFAHCKNLYYSNKTLIGNWYQDRFNNTDNNHAIVPAIVQQKMCPRATCYPDKYGAQTQDHRNYNHWRLIGFRNAERGKTSNVPLKYPDTFLKNLDRADQLVGQGKFVIQQRRRGVANEPDPSTKYGDRNDFGLRRRLECKIREERHPCRVSTTYCSHYSAPHGTRDPMERFLQQLEQQGLCTTNETGDGASKANTEEPKPGYEIMKDLLEAAERGDSNLTMYKLLSAAEKAGVLPELVKHMEPEKDDEKNREKIDTTNNQYPWDYFRRKI